MQQPRHAAAALLGSSGRARRRNAAAGSGGCVAALVVANVAVAAVDGTAHAAAGVAASVDAVDLFLVL